MNITGMLWGHKLLKRVDFPAAEILGPDATPDAVEAMIAKWGQVIVKPVFRGGVGKKGKAGLIGFCDTAKKAMAERERLYFAEHRVGNVVAKAEGVTFESAIPAQYEVYVSIGDSTAHRAPALTITHHGGVDVEDLGSDQIITMPFDAYTGLSGHVVSEALKKIGAPAEVISPLVQHVPKLWELFRAYGMSLVELNPIRMMPQKGRLVPVACDFKCSFDGDDPAWRRFDLPESLFAEDLSPFEQEVNALRTYQGQSDVFVTNEKGTITAMTFGGGASTLVTELLGDAGTISSDFGGNPPYEKMKAIAQIVYKYWVPQSNVLMMIGGKANNTDIYETFRAMADALRAHWNAHGPKPLYVVVGRGGPNLIRGLGYLRETLDNLKIPYSMFGYDSDISKVVTFAREMDAWIASGGGRAEIARVMGIKEQEAQKKAA
ncbi:MAG TPA: carboxylate--amine ligase [Rhodospirillaceae bacterium]|nr:carboxylate--amine ligase [Alphaproteobacteria bacterium]HBH26370.1 carboxylate--amine ligase [Rhodospirillaceae bacterium]